jgi:hypothetical protein
MTSSASPRSKKSTPFAFGQKAEKSMKSPLKSLLFVILAAMALVATIESVPKAHANSTGALVQPRIAIYNEVGVNQTTTLTSPVMTLTNVSECSVLAASGTSTRVLTSNWLANDGVTILYSLTTTVATSTFANVVISPTAAAPATPPTGLVPVPSTTGRKMQFSLAAGSSTGSLAILCD